MNENETRLNTIKNYLTMIESLSNQQAIYEKESDNWLKIEHNLVEIECQLFNELLLFDYNETEYFFKEVPILSLLALHLWKYFDKPDFMNEITLLNESAIVLIGIFGNTIKNS
jgi:hypothetical protein